MVSFESSARASVKLATDDVSIDGQPIHVHPALRFIVWLVMSGTIPVMLKSPPLVRRAR